MRIAFMLSVAAVITVPAAAQTQPAVAGTWEGVQHVTIDAAVRELPSTLTVRQDKNGTRVRADWKSETGRTAGQLRGTLHADGRFAGTITARGIGQTTD